MSSHTPKSRMVAMPHRNPTIWASSLAHMRRGNIALMAIARPPSLGTAVVVDLAVGRQVDDVHPLREANERPYRDHGHESGDDKAEE